MPVAVQGRDGWQSYPGTQDFLSSLQSLAEQQQAHPLFKWDQPLYVARAPGRLDVMGGIADYSGALVLQMPIAEACFVALQLERNQQVPMVHVESCGAAGTRSSAYSVPTSDLFPQGSPLAYADAYNKFQADPQTAWAAYVVGCLPVLGIERGVALADCSVSILVSSQVPEGKGVSSSAALEVATMYALIGALGLELSGWELAVLCQKVENRVVGAPCGIMDQMACTLGEEGKLMALLCQPAHVEGSVSIPSHLKVWGIDSGVRHSVGGSDYGSVRVGAFMGLKILQQAQAQQQPPQGPPPQHLVHVRSSEFATWVHDLLPVSIRGKEFLATHGEHVDSVTTVDPQQEYAVRTPSSHPIAEDGRVRLFRQLLAAPASPEQCTMLGELMFQSHASYSACKLGSPGTDRLVAMVRAHLQAASAASTPPLLYGAKITGGGCGGTVCVLGAASEAAEQAVMRIAQEYWQECGYKGQCKVFSGSSGGAASLGHLVVTLTGN